MPSIFSHALVGAVMGNSLTSRRMPFRFWALTITCAILPDIDVLGSAFGASYNGLLGHRGLTHSIFFAVLLGVAAGTFAFARLKNRFGRFALILYFILVTLSHCLMDALTNAGRGVAFFAPFSSGRFFFRWRPIEASPIGFRFFSARGLVALETEIGWIWLPALSLVLIVWICRNIHPRNIK